MARRAPLSECYVARDAGVSVATVSRVLAGSTTRRAAEAVGNSSVALTGDARRMEDVQALETKRRFLALAGDLSVPFLLVSDEVGLGVVPESEAGRRFRDVLGLVNQRAAEAAEEVHLCVAGVGVRIK